MKTPLRVLIVEDSVDDADLLLVELRRGGYEVVSERVTTPAGMTAALANAPWDLVLADYSLPAFSAPAALELLKNSGLDLPFIVVSGSIGEDAAVAVMKAGANDYVMKSHLKRLLPAIDRELSDAMVRRERRRVEEELRQQEAHFKSLIENSSDIITVIDARGVIQYDSPSVERVLGYRQGELVGQSIFHYVHSHDLPRLRSIVVQGAREIGKALLVEFRFRHQDGSWRMLESWGRGYRDAAGSTLGIINSRDITVRKQEEQTLRTTIQALQQAQAQLVQSEKMASLGQLAAGVAHEINNPVGYVKSNLGTFKDYVEALSRLLAAYDAVLQACEREDAAAVKTATAKVRTLAEQVKAGALLEDLGTLVRESIEGVGRIQQIVLNLKQFSRVDEAAQTRSNLNDGIESTLKIVWNELKYKAEVIKELGSLPDMLCYPQQLNQVWMNLLVNAAQAIPEKGTIMIRSHATDGAVVVEVEDTGQGIPPEHLEKIFDPFFTTKPVGKGTGLGLSVSYGIVQKHGGMIEVESRVGHGTLFRVRLPVSEPTH